MINSKIYFQTNSNYWFGSDINIEFSHTHYTFSLWLLLLLLLLSLFREVESRGKTMEPKKPGNTPRLGSEVVQKKGVAKSGWLKESVAGQCRVR